MHPINFEAVNKVFTAPNGLSEQECGNLPAFVFNQEGGMPGIMTCWQPSEEEIKNIVEGRPVVLVLYTRFMPVTMVGTMNENGQVV